MAASTSRSLPSWTSASSRTSSSFSLHMAPRAHGGGAPAWLGFRWTQPLTLARAADDDDAPPLVGTTGGTFELVWSSNQASRVNEDNMDHLWAVNPKLAKEGQPWCHETGKPEVGGLLIATPSTSRELGSPRYEQVVVLLVEHGDQGSIGLILNRPTGMVMGKKPNGMPFVLTNAPSEVQTVFQDNRLYCGGFTAQHVIHLIHGHALEGARQVTPGIYMGGELAAAAEVAAGRLPAEDFRFFAGALVWDRGELDEQAASGCWYTAASSRMIALKQCIQLPTPLWREVLMLMGGSFTQVAEDAELE